MVRLILVNDARRRGVGIGVPRDEIPLADGNRIELQLRSTLVDQGLAYGDGNGMPDAAVLAHGDLVLEHDPRGGVVILVGVGAGGEIDDLIGLDGAGARVDRKGADAGQVVHFQAEDFAVLGEGHARCHPMVAGVDVGDERFQAVGDELDRSAHRHGDGGGGHLVGVGVDLDAVGAADVLADHPHLVLVEPEMEGDEVLRHVRALHRHMKR